MYSTAGWERWSERWIKLQGCLWKFSRSLGMLCWVIKEPCTFVLVNHCLSLFFRSLSALLKMSLTLTWRPWWSKRVQRKLEMQWKLTSALSKRVCNWEGEVLWEPIWTNSKEGMGVKRGVARSISTERCQSNNRNFPVFLEIVKIREEAFLDLDSIVQPRKIGFGDNAVINSIFEFVF